MFWTMKWSMHNDTYCFLKVNALSFLPRLSDSRWFAVFRHKSRTDDSHPLCISTSKCSPLLFQTYEKRFSSLISDYWRSFRSSETSSTEDRRHKGKQFLEMTSETLQTSNEKQNSFSKWPLKHCKQQKKTQLVNWLMIFIRFLMFPCLEREIISRNDLWNTANSKRRPTYKLIDDFHSFSDVSKFGKTNEMISVLCFEFFWKLFGFSLWTAHFYTFFLLHHHHSCNSKLYNQLWYLIFPSIFRC